MKLISKKERKKLLDVLLDQYGLELSNYEFYSSDGGLGKKIFISNIPYILFRMGKILDLTRLNISKLGMYFCEFTKHGIRLSLDASQLFGMYAKKNIIEISEQQLKDWIIGNNIELKNQIERRKYHFYLVKYRSFFFGCGKISKDGKILYNYIPKSRRVKEGIVHQLIF